MNCNSQDSENKAYIIQDTTDWEAIMNSSKMDGTAKTYFDRGMVFIVGRVQSISSKCK